MLKLLPADAWIYDCEWTPDPVTIRLVYALPCDMPDSDVIEHAYATARAKQERSGRTPDERPMLKTALCRIVAVSAVKRSERGGKVRLSLKSLPALDGAPYDERDLVDKFLASVGAAQPQLVGFACREADLPILIQRAIVHRLHQPQFAKRPDKPWLGVDYFAKQTDWHVDLLDILSNYSRGTQMPSLHEICVASGIPGKFLVGGGDVAKLWAEGKVTEIVRYNQCDVLSQYELYMRVALLAGLIAPDKYAEEEALFAQLLVDLIGTETLVGPSQEHLVAYTAERHRLRQALYPRPDPAPVESPELALAP